MLPQSVVSTEVIDAPFLFPRNITRLPHVDYEHGGRGIQDPADGLTSKVWRCDYLEGEFVLSASGVSPTAVLAVPAVFRFGFTFDQNMQPAIAYELEGDSPGVGGGGSYFWWFDTVEGQHVTTELPAGSYSPLCTLDDKRRLQVGSSDIILAYMRAGTLYARVQRDRYQTEYPMVSGQGKRTIIQIGMNIRLRFQFHLSTA